MRAYTSLVLSLGLMWSLSGCGDSAGDGAGGTGGVGGGGTETTLISGTVTAGDDAETALEGATVSVVGTEISTTTDADGSWSLEVPVGEVFIMAQAEGFWGVIDFENVPDEGLAELELEVVSEEQVAEISDALGQFVDPDKGIFAVGFGDGTARGGEYAEISGANDFTFVFDEEEAPVMGSELIENGDTGLIFVGTEIGDAVTVTATDPDDEACPSEAGAYPVVAKTITDVSVACL